MRTFLLVLFAALVTNTAIPNKAVAQVSDDVVKIGILNDQSGPYADLAGPGSVVAAKMAIEDFGGSVKGKPIELVIADHQNKPDIGSNLARRWFDADKVDVIVDLLNSAVALAVQQVGKQSNKIVIGTSIGTPDFTGKACTPTSFVWTLDSYALSSSLAKGLVKHGLETWYLLAVDYSFGHALEADIRKALEQSGGKVVGAVRHPLNTSDFSSFLLQAQASKAKVVALANAGNDFITATKQANEFGITKGQQLVALVVYITDVHSLGLKVAQGLTFASAFYWDRTEESRAWSRRFFARFERMPTQAQASVYSAVTHYLKAVDAAGTDSTKEVAGKMRSMPVKDFFANAKIRADGLLQHDMYLVQAKSPASSKEPWDYYKVLGTVPGSEAFRSLSESECPLVKD